MQINNIMTLIKIAEKNLPDQIGSEIIILIVLVDFLLFRLELLCHLHQGRHASMWASWSQHQQGAQVCDHRSDWHISSMWSWHYGTPNTAHNLQTKNLC
jgi:hypothetical protein